jgi:N-acetylmuramoyl-L-alanine amidase
MRAAAILLATLFVGQTLLADTWNVVMHGGRRHVPIGDVANFYKLSQTVSGNSAFELTGPDRVIKGKAGQRDVLINGVKYVLCFPLVSRSGTVYVSAMDVTKIIEPVLRPGKIKNAAEVKTVILDPGHGGHDSGATGPLGKESRFALDVALRARALLQQNGYQVRMTRTTDVFIPLEERSRFANKHPNAVFVSVHFNKSKTTGGTGIETYALAPRGVPSMDEDNLSYSDFKLNPGNARDGENIALAAAMHSAMVKNLRVTDRGIKRARFHVIRTIKIPGVLLEGGFMNNPQDSRLIASGEYRQRIAQSIVEAVQNYRRAVGIGRTAPPTLVVSADTAVAGTTVSKAPPSEDTSAIEKTAAPVEVETSPGERKDSAD